jgi:hypothetical protein
METGEFIKIQDMINNLYKRVELLSKEKIVQHEPNSSATTKNLMDALAKAQAEYTIAYLNKSNPYTKNPYADYKAVVEASRPALTKYGIAVDQPIIETPDGSLWLYTIMSLGEEWKQAKMKIILSKNDIQFMHSYVTFLKRMNYTMFVGVVVHDEDDDGEEAVATSREVFAKGTALNYNYDSKDQGVEVITKEQLDEFNYELREYPELCDQLLTTFHHRSLADIPKKKYREVMHKLREIKQARNEIENRKK